MKALVFGSAGMLGTDLIGALADSGHPYVALPRSACDITNPKDVRQALEDSGAQIVFNCAAYTKVDDAEVNAETAYAINGVGPATIARLTHELGVAMVHVSTDYVFDGQAQEPYLESAPIAPMSVYGKSKALGDYQVQRLNPKHILVRTQWLYGANGPNFVRTMLRLGTTRNELTVVDDQTGSPTYTYDLARALVQLAADESYGTYHLTNSGSCTWKQLAEVIFQQAELSVQVNGISTEAYGSPAPRPRYGVLDNRMWLSQGRKPLRHFTAALSHFLSHNLDKATS
jgi:dTDP-4-dehydrorhamnose reductase